MAVKTPMKSAASTSPALHPQGHHAGKPPISLSKTVILVGSRHNAHLHLLSRSVSKAHALILSFEGNVYIRDLASREGIYVNGRQVREAWLKDGDLLKVGSFSFKYKDGTGKKRIATQVAHVADLEVEGADAPLSVSEKVMLIGRRPTCDVSLIEASVSTAHAVLFEISGHWFLRDLGSRTGTWVNEEKVHQQELALGDTLRIGETQMRFVSAGTHGHAIVPADVATEEEGAEPGVPPMVTGAAAGAVGAAAGAPGVDAELDLLGMAADQPVEPIAPPAGPAEQPAFDAELERDLSTSFAPAEPTVPVAEESVEIPLEPPAPPRPIPRRPAWSQSDSEPIPVDEGAPAPLPPLPAAPPRAGRPAIPAEDLVQIDLAGEVDPNEAPAGQTRALGLHMDDDGVAEGADEHAPAAAIDPELENIDHEAAQAGQHDAGADEPIDLIPIAMEPVAEPGADAAVAEPEAPAEAGLLLGNDLLGAADAPPVVETAAVEEAVVEETPLEPVVEESAIVEDATGEAIPDELPQTVDGELALPASAVEPIETPAGEGWTSPDLVGPVADVTEEAAVVEESAVAEESATGEEPIAWDAPMAAAEPAPERTVGEEPVAEAEAADQAAIAPAVDEVAFAEPLAPVDEVAAETPADTGVIDIAAPAEVDVDIEPASPMAEDAEPVAETPVEAAADVAPVEAPVEATVEATPVEAAIEVAPVDTTAEVAAAETPIVSGDVAADVPADDAPVDPDSLSLAQAVQMASDALADEAAPTPEPAEPEPVAALEPEAAPWEPAPVEDAVVEDVPVAELPSEDAAWEAAAAEPSAVEPIVAEPMVLEPVVGPVVEEPVAEEPVAAAPTPIEVTADADVLPAIDPEATSVAAVSADTADSLAWSDAAQPAESGAAGDAEIDPFDEAWEGRRIAREEDATPVMPAAANQTNEEPAALEPAAETPVADEPVVTAPAAEVPSGTDEDWPGAGDAAGGSETPAELAPSQDQPAAIEPAAVPAEEPAGDEGAWNFVSGDADSELEPPTKVAAEMAVDEPVVETTPAPEIPAEMPASEMPVAGVPVDAPAEASVNELPDAEQPAETPVESPAELPVAEQPAETPAESPAELPVAEQPAEAPIDELASLDAILDAELAAAAAGPETVAEEEPLRAEAPTEASAQPPTVASSIDDLDRLLEELMPLEEPPVEQGSPEIPATAGAGEPARAEPAFGAVASTDMFLGDLPVDSLPADPSTPRAAGDHSITFAGDTLPLAGEISITTTDHLPPAGAVAELVEDQPTDEPAFADEGMAEAGPMSIEPSSDALQPGVGEVEELEDLEELEEVLILEEDTDVPEQGEAEPLESWDREPAVTADAPPAEDDAAGPAATGGDTASGELPVLELDSGDLGPMRSGRDPDALLALDQVDPDELDEIEVVEPTEPTVESALNFEAVADADVAAAAAPVEESAQSLSDTAFAMQVSEFTGDASGELVEETPVAAAEETVAEPAAAAADDAPADVSVEASLPQDELEALEGLAGIEDEVKDFDEQLADAFTQDVPAGEPAPEPVVEAGVEVEPEHGQEEPEAMAEAAPVEPAADELQPAPVIDDAPPVPTHRIPVTYALPPEEPAAEPPTADDHAIVEDVTAEPTELEPAEMPSTEEMTDATVAGDASDAIQWAQPVAQEPELLTEPEAAGVADAQAPLADDAPVAPAAETPAISDPFDGADPSDYDSGWVSPVVSDAPGAASATVPQPAEAFEPQVVASDAIAAGDPAAPAEALGAIVPAMPVATDLAPTEEPIEPPLGAHPVAEQFEPSGPDESMFVGGMPLYLPEPPPPPPTGFGAVPVAFAPASRDRALADQMQAAASGLRDVEQMDVGGFEEEPPPSDELEDYLPDGAPADEWNMELLMEQPDDGGAITALPVPDATLIHESPSLPAALPMADEPETDATVNQDELSAATDPGLTEPLMGLPHLEEPPMPTVIPWAGPGAIETIEELEAQESAAQAPGADDAPAAEPTAPMPLEEVPVEETAIAESPVEETPLEALETVDPFDAVAEAPAAIEEAPAIVPAAGPSDAFDLAEPEALTDEPQAEEPEQHEPVEPEPDAWSELQGASEPAGEDPLADEAPVEGGAVDETTIDEPAPIAEETPASDEPIAQDGGIDHEEPAAQATEPVMPAESDESAYGGVVDQATAQEIVEGAPTDESMSMTAAPEAPAEESDAPAQETDVPVDEAAAFGETAPEGSAGDPFAISPGGPAEGAIFGSTAPAAAVMADDMAAPFAGAGPVPQGDAFAPGVGPVDPGSFDTLLDQELGVGNPAGATAATPVPAAPSGRPGSRKPRPQRVIVPPRMGVLDAGVAAVEAAQQDAPGEPAAVPVPAAPRASGYRTIPQRKNIGVRILLLLVLMLVLMGLAAAGVWYLVKVRQTAEGSVRFNNIASLTREQFERFKQEQHDKFFGQNVRMGAQGQLAGRGVTAGFLHEPEQLGRVQLRWADNRPDTMHVVFSGVDPLDRARIFAMLEALYQENAGSMDRQIRLKSEVTAIERRIKELDEAKARYAEIKKVIDAAPTADDIRKLEGAAREAEIQYDLAVAAVKDAELALKRADEALLLTPAGKNGGGDAKNVPTAAASDDELKLMGKALADVTAKLDAARSAASEEADTRRQALDKAVESFQQSAAELSKGGGELAAYVSAVQQLQERTHKLSGQLIDVQQQQHKRLSTLKKDLDDQIQARKIELWAADKALAELHAQYDLAQRKYRAAIDPQSGLAADSPEVKQALNDIKDVTVRIEARKAELGSDPIVKKVGDGLEELIALTQKGLEADRQRIEQDIRSQEQAFAQSGIVEKLPEAQRKAAASLKERQDQINELRRQYSASLDKKNAESNESIKTMESQARALSTKIEERKRLLASDTSKKLTQEQEQQRQATLAKLQANLKTAQDQVGMARTVYLERNKTLEAARSKVDGLADQRQLAEAIKSKLQTDEAQAEIDRLALEEKRQQLAAVVTPVRPSESDVNIVERKDDRPLYVAGAVMALALIFGLLATFTAMGADKHATEVHGPGLAGEEDLAAPAAGGDVEAGPMAIDEIGPNPKDSRRRRRAG